MCGLIVPELGRLIQQLTIMSVEGDMEKIGFVEIGFVAGIILLGIIGIRLILEDGVNWFTVPIAGLFILFIGCMVGSIIMG